MDDLYFASYICYKGAIKLPDTTVLNDVSRIISVNLGYYLCAPTNTVPAIDKEASEIADTVLEGLSMDDWKISTAVLTDRIRDILTGSYVGNGVKLVSPNQASINIELYNILSNSMGFGGFNVTLRYAPRLSQGIYVSGPGAKGFSELGVATNGLVYTANKAREPFSVGKVDASGNVTLLYPLKPGVLSLDMQIRDSNLTNSDVARLNTEADKRMMSTINLSSNIGRPLNLSSSMMSTGIKLSSGITTALSNITDTNKNLMSSSIDLSKTIGRYADVFAYINDFSLNDEMLEIAAEMIALAPTDSYNMLEMINNCMKLLIDNQICTEKNKIAWFIKISVSLSKGGFSKNADYEKVFETQMNNDKEKLALYRKVGKMLNSLKVTPVSDQKDSAPTLSRWSEAIYYFLASKKIMNNIKLSESILSPSTWCRKGYTDDVMFSSGFELNGNNTTYWSNLGTMMRIQTKSLDRVKKSTKLIDLMISSIRKRTAIGNATENPFTFSTGQVVNCWDLANMDDLNINLPEVEKECIRHGFCFRNSLKWEFSKIIDILKADSEKIDNPKSK